MSAVGPEDDKVSQTSKKAELIEEIKEQENREAEMKAQEIEDDADLKMLKQKLVAMESTPPPENKDEKIKYLT